VVARVALICGRPARGSRLVSLSTRRARRRRCRCRLRFSSGAADPATVALPRGVDFPAVLRVMTPVCPVWFGLAASAFRIRDLAPGNGRITGRRLSGSPLRCGSLRVERDSTPRLHSTRARPSPRSWLLASLSGASVPLRSSGLGPSRLAAAQVASVVVALPPFRLGILRVRSGKPSPPAPRPGGGENPRARIARTGRSAPVAERVGLQPLVCEGGMTSRALCGSLATSR